MDAIDPDRLYPLSEACRQVMLDALAGIGKELGWPESLWVEFDASSEEQLALINRAWDIAKEEKFSVK